MDSKIALKLYVVLTRAYHAAAEADKKEIRKRGLGPSEFAVLELLYHKGEQPIQQIAAKVLLTSGSMTYVVTQLERKGFISRRVCEKDKRVFFADLTEQGRALITEMFPAHEAFLTDLFGVLTDEEAQQLTRQLKQLGKSIAGRRENEK